MFVAGVMLVTLAACNSPEVVNDTQLGNSGVHTASDYNEIFEMIKALQAKSGYNNYGMDDGAVMNMAEENEVSPAMTTSVSMDMADNDAGRAESVTSGEMAMGGGGDEKDADYSDTNNQVDGIQEGDIVKTDGKHIFVAMSHPEPKINVVRVDKGNMELIASIEYEDAYPREMLVYDGKLVVIWNHNTYVENPEARISNEYYWGWWGWYDVNTIVEVYDVNGSFNNPVSSFSQKGYYNSSRMIDNIVYLVSSYYPEGWRMGELVAEDLDSYIPSYTINGVKTFVAPSSIVLPEQLSEVQYTIIAGLDVNSSNICINVEANLGSSHIVYSSFDNIYVTGYSYDEINDWNWEEYTVINKFALNKGNVKFNASAKVRGNVGTQFYMDEHKGILRLVTQVWGYTGDGEPQDVQARNDIGIDAGIAINEPMTESETSVTTAVVDIEEQWDEVEWDWNWGWWSNWGSLGASLYTFDKDMKILDSVHGIGGDESVQSVRFAGDIGYIVTFFITDPLFSFDLSDPGNIKQLDELKIPGFSRYLHQWGDGLLLGIGVDADEEDGTRTGLKLSMFNVSDNENLSELHTYVLEAPVITDQWGSWSWMWTPAEHDHKSILISVERNIIAFPYTYYGGDGMDYQKYVMFSYDSSGFKLIGEIDKPNYDRYYSWYGFERGLYIDDYLYVISPDMIVSAKLSDMSVVQELVLFDYEEYYRKWEEYWNNYYEEYPEEYWGYDYGDEEYVVYESPPYNVDDDYPVAETTVGIVALPETIEPRIAG